MGRMVTQDLPNVGGRMRALRMLSGYENMPDLAAALKARGVGRGLAEANLYKLERGTKHPEYRDMREIADLCNVPVEWFTADFTRLAEISEDPRKVLARVANEAAQRTEERRSRRRASPDDPPPEHP